MTSDSHATWLSVAVDAEATAVAVQMGGTWYDLTPQSWTVGPQPVFATYAINIPAGAMLTLKAAAANGSSATTQSFAFQYKTELLPQLSGSTGPSPTPTGTPSGNEVLDPNWRTQVNYVGRFDQSNANGPFFSWSACGIQAAFQGTNISIKLARTDVWGDSFLNVKIDDTTPFSLKVDHDGMYSLASGLTAGNHTLEVSRRDEGMYADIQYLGLALDQGKLLSPPARPGRRIEFIGDSITCGYGNEASSAYAGFTTATENAYLAYGSITARQLNAEVSVIAWSGIGIYRGTDPMPTIYGRTLAKSNSPAWDFSTWIPQVVVINLCTNDFGGGTVPDRAGFVKAYKDFIATLRSHYPQAHLFCVVGPMLSGSSLTTATDYIQGDVVNVLASAGDLKIHFLEFPVQEYSDHLGADWHPGLITHQKMADQLSAAIKTTLGW